MSFLRISRFTLAFSALLILGSAVALWNPGPNLSIEFTGGTLVEVRAPDITTDQLETALEGISFGEEPAQVASLSRASDGSYFIRLQSLSNEQHNQLLSDLESSLNTEIESRQFTTIGPTVGESLKRRSLIALGLAAVAIVLYLAFAFRNVPKEVNAWSFGFMAIVALLHDVIIIGGIFTILSHVTTFQMDTLFATALLSIMGYSVSDTIVIFDRIRDLLDQKGKQGSFATIAVQALRQSLTRTLNTSLSTLLVLTSLFFLGAESIRWFVLTLIMGAIVGTYSSFFVATPLLIFWRSRSSSHGR